MVLKKSWMWIHGIIVVMHRRKWQPSTAPANEEWQMVHQVVVLKMHRREVLHLAHASPMGGHLGINKMYQKVLNYFY